jgi:hypothetical protein
MAKKYISDIIESTSITGSLFGTSSWAVSSSHALNGGVTRIVAGTNVTINNGGSGSVTINASGGGGSAFPFTGSAQITGSLGVTGSIEVDGLRISTGSGGGSNNIAIGNLLLGNNTTGIGNVAIGYNVLSSNTTGFYNIGQGNRALENNRSGIGNIAMGSQALFINDSGNNNIALGGSTLRYNTFGGNNIAIGPTAGLYNTDGSDNLYLGNGAGPLNYTTENKKLYISSGSGTPLIGGDFAAKTVTISGSLRVTGPITGSIQSASYALSSSVAVSSSFATNATSASHALNGGVTRIVAGTNVSITNGGSGSVTISASGGGSAFPFTGSAGISGSLNVNGAVTASFFRGDGSALTGVTSTPIAHLEFNNTDLTVWNNGKGNISTNTSFGDGALRSNTTGAQNTAIGNNALLSNTTGVHNTAIGSFALLSNTTGFSNTVIGSNALLSNTTGTQNTAIGRWALELNTTGDSNTAIGHTALTKNTTGIQNISIGIVSLFNNTTGNTNVSIGVSALTSNTTGSMNTAVGASALQGNTTGDSNTGIGRSSLFSNTTGTDNIAIGNGAGGFIANGSTNTITSASVFLGSNTRALNNNETNQIVIGQSAIGGGSNTVTLGNNSITTLRCQTTSITSLSDSRDKKEILPISEGIEFVNKLKPITFKWDTRDGAKTDIKAAGFIAQDLLEVQESSEIGDHLDLVSNTDPDKLEARYSNLLPVMVKAIQDLSQQVQELQNEILILKDK